MGTLYVQFVTSGGLGSEGVSGTGVGLEGPFRRFRGSSLGIRVLRFGISVADGADACGSTFGGIVEVDIALMC